MQLINKERNSKTSGERPLQIKGTQTARWGSPVSEGFSAGTPRRKPAATLMQESLQQGRGQCKSAGHLRIPALVPSVLFSFKTAPSNRHGDL